MLIDRPQDMAGDKARRLVVTPSISAARADGGLFLDDKVVSGLIESCRTWPGPVRAIFREGPRSAIVFGQPYDPATLGFELALVDAGAPIPDALLADADIILAAGDSHHDFPLQAQARRLGIPIVYIIENLIRTRLQIIGVSGASAWQRMKSSLWAIGSEIQRRRVFRGAAALQANGTPAADVYGRAHGDVLCYFDTRLSRSMMCDEQAMDKRFQRLRSGSPLRLAFSGRLEPLKGADHLIPVARELVARNVAFHLDIFGTGSLENGMRAAIEKGGLSESVTLHGSVDFETRLAPIMCDEIDLFLCCHRQSDPSCTYLETFGCGVPIVAYRNRAFDGMLALASAGWSVPADDPAAMADRVAALNGNREQLVAAAIAARDFAGEHDVEKTFAARMAHLLAVLDRTTAHAG